MQMALGSWFRGMLWSVLVLLTAEESSDIVVQQPPGPIYVQSGGDLKLECRVTGTFRAGPVKWFKGEGASRQLIFSNYEVLDRVTRKEKDSNADFTVLHHVVPEDEGDYYCVKQKIKVGGYEELQSGDGTKVFVDDPFL